MMLNLLVAFLLDVFFASYNDLRVKNAQRDGRPLQSLLLHEPVAVIMRSPFRFNPVLGWAECGVESLCFEAKIELLLGLSYHQSQLVAQGRIDASPVHPQRH